MNRTHYLATFVGVSLMAGVIVLAQEKGTSNFDLSWNTMDGGGGSSAGGNFELAGTIGQPDAGGPITGGGFSLVGGFWPGASDEPVDPCPADIAGGDSQVNVDDLLAVINGWGACPGPCPPACNADIAPLPDGDCNVNIDDLLGVINAWGPCP